MIKNNNHPVDELELMAYLDGELSRVRAAAAAAHLEACLDCKALANELSGISRELAGWQIESSQTEITPPISAELERHVRSHENSLHKNRRIPVQAWSRRRVLMGSLGAVVLVTLLVSIWKPSVMRSHLSANQSDAASRLRTAKIAALLSANPSSPAPMAKLEAERGTIGSLDKDQPGQGLPLPRPMIVRSAELALTTADFERTRARLEEVLKRHNGYLGDLTIAGATSSARTLTATLRVPSDQLDATIAEMKSLGRVEEESQKGEEVSQQYVDLQARLLNARNSEQRLTELLRRAGKLSDVLAVEEQIENVRENIERMEAERKNLAKQVDFSTLDVRVAEDFKESVHVVPDSTSTRFRNAAVEGYEVMVAGLINLLLFMISWGPSFLLWGAILFFPARWLWRRRQGGIF